MLPFGFQPNGPAAMSRRVCHRRRPPKTFNQGLEPAVFCLRPIVSTARAFADDVWPVPAQPLLHSTAACLAPKGMQRVKDGDVAWCPVRQLQRRKRAYVIQASQRLVWFLPTGMEETNGSEEGSQSGADRDGVGPDAGIYPQFRQPVARDDAAQCAAHRRGIPQVDLHAFPGYSRAIEQAMHIHSPLQMVLVSLVVLVLQQEECVSLHDLQRPNHMRRAAESEGRGVYTSTNGRQSLQSLHRQITTIKFMSIIGPRMVGGSVIPMNHTQRPETNHHGVQRNVQ